MKNWMLPTLVRRVFFSLLIAGLLVWLVIMARALIINTGESKTRNEVSDLGTYLLDGLARIDNAQAARAFVMGAVGETQRPTYKWRNFKAIKVQLSDQHGAPLLSNLAPGDPAIAGKVNEVKPWVYRGHTFLAFEGRTSQWSISVALPMHTVAGILRDDWREVTINILLAFPFVFLLVWVAVARGLRPLQRISDRIAARGKDDLSALNLDPKYAELTPLVSALDHLLRQLRDKIQREHAFLQDAAHELGTPLAVISAQAHVLSKASSVPERLEAEQRMDGAIARAAHLMQQLLQLARVEIAPALDLQPLDIAQLVRQELARAAPAAMRRELELSLDAPDTLWCALDLQAFLSILHNLLDNAILYVHAGGRIAVEVKEQDGMLTLALADNGPGIAEDRRALVFERFHRGGEHDAAGSGLGLAIARQAAGRLGGTIQLASGLSGGGCRFVLICPVCIADAQLNATGASSNALTPQIEGRC